MHMRHTGKCFECCISNYWRLTNLKKISTISLITVPADGLSSLGAIKLTVIKEFRTAQHSSAQHGDRLNIKMPSHQYRGSHYKDKMVVRPFNFLVGIPILGKMETGPSTLRIHILFAFANTVACFTHWYVRPDTNIDLYSTIKHNHRKQCYCIIECCILSPQWHNFHDWVDKHSLLMHGIKFEGFAKFIVEWKASEYVYLHYMHYILVPKRPYHRRIV